MFSIGELTIRSSRLDTLVWIENNIKVDLLSDQTSCHEVYDGGYTPYGMSFEERTRLLK